MSTEQMLAKIAHTGRGAYADPMVVFSLMLVLVGCALAFTRVGNLPLFLGIGLLFGRLSRIGGKQ